jgi:hypothetical protein
MKTAETASSRHNRMGFTASTSALFKAGILLANYITRKAIWPESLAVPMLKISYPRGAEVLSRKPIL